MQEKHSIDELQVFKRLSRAGHLAPKKSKIRSYILKVFIVSIILSLVTYIYLDARRDQNGFRNQNASGESIQTTDLPKRVNNPPGLRFVEVAPNSFLSVSGVINNTNRARREEGLTELSTNTTLNLSALRKAQDMLNQQYFEHESPDGIDVAGLATSVGYEYIVIGENLALGNFEDDSALVTGWMNSPGHRENILNTKYTEIGVSVLRGVFEGVETWVAVQHFGFPTSACPGPNANLKFTIDQNNSILDALAAELTALKSELDGMNTSEPEYNQKVSVYNAKVSSYNTLLEETKSQIASYNTEVNNFNDCAN